MVKFAFKNIEELNCTQIIQKLEINGICQFDQFKGKINSDAQQYQSEFGQVMLYIERDGNGQNLPSEKKKDITPENEDIKEYEYRTKHLRIYAIKKKGGKIIILGGFKNRQKKDIKRFRNIKNQLVNSKIFKNE